MAGGIRLENYRSVENLFPIFELLEQSTSIGAKQEALRILAHISGDKECRSAIRQTGGFAILVDFLKDGAIVNAALVDRAVRTIRNLANDSAGTRKALRLAGATEHLIPLIAHDEESRTSVDAIAAVGYLAHHDQQTKATVRKMGGVPLLVRMLHADPKKPITCYAAAALHNLIDGSARNKNALRAAGAVPRLVQLLDCEIGNPIVEVALRTLHKLAEKFEDAQADIRRTGGLGKLIELQTKTTSASLLSWTEKTMQTLKLSEKERDDSKVLLTLGNTLQKEFDKLRNGTDQVLLHVSEIGDALKASRLDCNERNDSLTTENDKLRGELSFFYRNLPIVLRSDLAMVAEKDVQLDEMQGILEDQAIEFESLESNLREKENLVHDLEKKINEKQDTLRECEDRLHEKDVHFGKLKESLQEKSQELKQSSNLLEEKNHHIQHLEAVIIEKERHIQQALHAEREETERAKQERNATILDLVHTLRDVVSTRPASPEASKQQEISNISASIQSLIQTPLQKPSVEEATAERPQPLATRPSLSARFAADAAEQPKPNPRDPLIRRASFAPSPLRKHQSLRHASSLSPARQDALGKTQSLPVQERMARLSSIDRQTSIHRQLS